jgi:hypothetical protein
MTPSSRVHPVVSCGPSNFDPVKTTVRAAPADQRSARAASQRVESTGSMPSLTSRRCAPSPCATCALIPDSAPSLLEAHPARPVPSCGSGRVAVFASAAGAPPLPPTGRWRRPPFWRPTRCAAAPRPRTRALSAPSRLWLLTTGARSALTGTSMRVAAAADGVALTARVPGVVAAAVASTANVSGALRDCLHEVRAARKKCRVHVREATCTQLNSTQLNSSQRRSHGASRTHRPRLTPPRSPR